MEIVCRIYDEMDEVCLIADSQIRIPFASIRKSERMRNGCERLLVRR